MRFAVDRENKIIYCDEDFTEEELEKIKEIYVNFEWKI